MAPVERFCRDGLRLEYERNGCFRHDSTLAFLAVFAKMVFVTYTIMIIGVCVAIDTWRGGWLWRGHADVTPTVGALLGQHNRRQPVHRQGNDQSRQHERA